jgi:hypothetical protein
LRRQIEKGADAVFPMDADAMTRVPFDEQFLIARTVEAFGVLVDLMTYAPRWPLFSCLSTTSGMLEYLRAAASMPIVPYDLSKGTRRVCDGFLLTTDDEPQLQQAWLTRSLVRTIYRDIRMRSARAVGVTELEQYARMVEWEVRPRHAALRAEIPDRVWEPAMATLEHERQQAERRVESGQLIDTHASQFRPDTCVGMVEIFWTAIRWYPGAVMRPTRQLISEFERQHQDRADQASPEAPRPGDGCTSEASAEHLNDGPAAAQPSAEHSDEPSA